MWIAWTITFPYETLKFCFIPASQLDLKGHFCAKMDNNKYFHRTSHKNRNTIEFILWILSQRTNENQLFHSSVLCLDLKSVLNKFDYSLRSSLNKKLIQLAQEFGIISQNMADTRDLDVFVCVRICAFVYGVHKAVPFSRCEWFISTIQPLINTRYGKANSWTVSSWTIISMFAFICID